MVCSRGFWNLVDHVRPISVDWSRIYQHDTTTTKKKKKKKEEKKKKKIMIFISYGAYVNICYSILKVKTYSWLPNTHTHTHTSNSEKQLATSHRF